MKNETNTAAPAAPVSDAEWMADPQTIEAKRQWNTVADILRADRDDPDSVIAAAEAAARALHGVERFQSAAPAPVAGDAVAAELQTILRDARALGYMVDTSITFETLERAIAALAQDRASQGAAGGPDCLTCGDRGWIGGPTFQDPGEGGVQCPDCEALDKHASPPPVASQAGAAGVPESAREVIELLLQVAYRADVATDDSEDLGDGAGHNVGDAEFVELCNAIEALEALPDDQPGYVMGPAAKARWALRAILAAPTPAAEGEVR